jgi:uncharacterized protein (DUF1330 family)
MISPEQGEFYMTAYVIGTVYDVTDPVGFGEYRQLAQATVEKFGGKIVMGSDKVEAADGNWSPIGIVVLEFESLERAKQWYNSPEYSAVRPMRLESGTSGTIFADAP